MSDNTLFTKLSNQIDFDEENFFELVYFGSPNNICYFKKVTGRKIKFEDKYFLNKSDKNSIKLSLLTRLSQAYLGPGYENLYLPCTPSNEIIYTKLDDDLDNVIHIDTENAKDYDLNDSLLVKVNKQFINENNKEMFLQGWGSGVRSAIIPVKGNFYRLKGCGNNDQGFILKDMLFPKNGIEIRGCQFKSNSLREQYMSSKIESILLPYGFEVGNKPLAIWTYNEIESKEEGLSDERNLIEKTCSVYESIGDKRVGCHLMPGIEMLFIGIIIAYVKKYKTNMKIDQYCNYLKPIQLNSGFINCIKGLFIEERWERKAIPPTEEELKKQKEQYIENNNTSVSNNILFCDEEEDKLPEKKEPQYNQAIIDITCTYQFIDLILLKAKKEESIDFLFNKYDIYSETTNKRKYLTDFFELSNKYKQIALNDKIFTCSNSVEFSNSKDSSLAYNPSVPKLREENFDLLKYLTVDSINTQNKILKDFMLKTRKLNKYEALITEKIDKITNTNLSIVYLSCLLYSRLGYEIGKIKRIMQDNNINWGTYEDQPFRLHCNAHTDNILILSKERRKNHNGTPNLISILDFDLSFFKDNFININLDSQPDKYGKKDNILFDCLLNIERQHLEWEIGGMENMKIFDFLIDLKFNSDNDNEAIMSTDSFECLQDECFNIAFRSVVFLLRDNCILNYQDGYMKRQFKYNKEYLDNYDTISDLIDLGIGASHDFKG